MKNLQNIRILFVAALAMMYTTTSSAQTTDSTNYDQKFKLGFGVSGGIPTDGDDYDWALGGDVRLQYDLSKKTSITLTTGFTNLFVGDDVPDLGFIPAKAGFKAFVWEDQFYVMGEVGAGFAVTNGYNETSILWAPSIGYATKHLDISLRYEDYDKFDTNQIALRFAYGFEL
ncbi:hypothetical protein DMB65_00265 [Flavobacterium cheongpyeongense]|jgi:hypothetical protein|uniref:Outer membrane protein beta-barrel domain-containing protein n=1 Tax=Flavobacterium cheongpyeongense TaxID=2212651 RepID=A0A2V4BTW2_9FLAO|nr:hypothetical protein [Flavobacterium cheongpyeongense]PXY42499.1 hypothetical protein DMB65_00265 [Flavobacterium cheongpyeongense]